MTFEPDPEELAADAGMQEIIHQVFLDNLLTDEELASLVSSYNPSQVATTNEQRLAVEVTIRRAVIDKVVGSEITWNEDPGEHRAFVEQMVNSAKSFLARYRAPAKRSP